MKISRQGADYAREHLCNPEEHRKKWTEALTFRFTSYELRFDGF